MRGAELVIHNAPFDVGFIDAELDRLEPSVGALDTVCSVVDTLQMARHKHPGQRNNLDALCQRYEIDNTSRTLHGALLDAEILAEVYLAMTGGQASLGLGAESSDASSNGIRAGKRHQALSRRKEAPLTVLQGKPGRDRATRGQAPGARPQCGRGGVAEITPPLIQRLTYTAAKPTDVNTIV